MASSAELRGVNLTGLVQGITLVAFPAASSIFTDPTGYDLSGTQCGARFLRSSPDRAELVLNALLGLGTVRASRNGLAS